jgi:hypothetical protein
VPRRWIAPLVVIVLTLAVPASASAHAAGPTVALDYRLELQAPPAGVHVSVLDGDRDLRVRVERGTLVVRGDLGEPMVRIGAAGAWANRASVTAVAEKLVAAGHGWVRLASGPSLTWHEHRLSPPPYDGGTSGPVARFRIPATLGGRTVALTGSFVRVSRPSSWPWLAAAVLLGVLLGAALRVRPRLRVPGAVALGCAAGAAGLVAFVAFSAADAPTGGVAWGRVAVVAAFGAGLTVALVRVQGIRRAHLAGVVGAAAAALDLGSLGVFRHGVVVSALPATPTRALCALAIVAGLVALGASLSVHDDRDRRPVLVPKGAR